MRYLALATDYDGTLAHHGVVDEASLDALRRARDAGRTLIMVTGRELEDLMQVFPHLDLFHRVVAENGALLYRPADRQMKVLAERPPQEFIDALRARDVAPLSVGHVIVATWEPNETVVLETIRDLGLELHVVFNKGAVMVLPPTVNKATGLAAALEELGISAHNTVGVGDAENDFAFLDLCERAIAVANALPLLSDQCDAIMSERNGAGVRELIDAMLADDLRSVRAKRERFRLPLGATERDQPVELEPYGERILVSGPSGSGKSVLVSGVLERLAERAYQFCLIDPEGDYAEMNQSIALGDAQDAPTVSEIMAVLGKADASCVVNLLGLPLEERPSFFRSLLPHLQDLRDRTGRPHWLIVDEAHHMLPATGEGASADQLQAFGSVVFATVHPDLLSPAVVETVTTVLVVGKEPAATLEPIGDNPPRGIPDALHTGEALLWKPGAPDATRLRYTPPRFEKQRHKRKYAAGELGADRSFYFRGPDGKLNLQAQNLMMFEHIARGVDDETWLYHLRNGDYARWFRDMIKDDELAEEAERIAGDAGDSAERSRREMIDAVSARYTAPA